MRFWALFKPNICALGYALFLAVNAAGVWGGAFPFLPIEFQTPQIIQHFFVAQSLVFGLSYIASAIGVYFFPSPTRRFLVFAAGIPYFLGWACLIAAMYFEEAALALMTGGGALLGLGSAGFYMLWQRLFASLDPDSGTHDLIVGTAYSALLYFSLYLIPRAVTALIIPLVFLPLFGLCIVLKSRAIDPNQPMFDDVPREHPQVYRQALIDYWRSALCVGALGFGCGIVRSLAVGDPQLGSIVNIVSMLGSLGAATALLLAWRTKSLRLSVIAIYRVLFPFVVSAFFIMAFAGTGFLSVFAGVMYAFYSCGIILMMIQCAQASRDRGINPIFIYGFFGGVVYVLHDLGFIAGTFSESLSAFGLSPIAGAAITATYLLAIMYFVGQGGFRRVLAAAKPDAESIEFVALGAPKERNRFSSHSASRSAAMPSSAIGITKTSGMAPSAKNASDSQEVDIPASSNISEKASQKKHGRSHTADEPTYRDRISKQCAALQRHYRLSAREAEVMELLARGNSVAAIAEQLVVSENTIRTHSKRIYSKLAIHKKQELLALVDSFNPEEVD